MKAYAFFESSLGRMLLAAGPDGLAGAWFVGQKHFPAIGPDWQQDEDHPLLCRSREQLTDYFAGTRHHFDLPLSPEGTAFQARVWKALSGIDYGKTRTYGELARQVGAPAASRAVGAAVGRNPLSVIVPCHRALGAGGRLTGYAGGLDRKRWLLALERAL